MEERKIGEMVWVAVYNQNGSVDQVEVGAVNGVQVLEGHLILTDTKGWTISAYAPGIWANVLPMDPPQPSTTTSQ